MQSKENYAGFKSQKSQMGLYGSNLMTKVFEISAHKNASSKNTMH